MRVLMLASLCCAFAAQATPVTLTILSASPSKTKVQYVPRVGVHGASILRTDRDPKGAAPAWAAVEKFLAAFP